MDKYSVTKMAYAAKDHGQSQAVGSRNGHFVANRASWLYDCHHSRLSSGFYTVGEREEGVGSHDCPPRSLARFGYRQLDRVYPAGQSAADANRGIVARQYNGLALDVLAGYPGKAQGSHLDGGWLALRDDAPLGARRITLV